MRRLEGRVALVSGSGRGIGRAIALKLAGEGAHVVVNDLDEAPARETANAITDNGGRAAVHCGDVTSKDFGEAFVGAALSAFGGLDIIINNAGYTWDSVIQKMSDEQFQAMLDVHLVAPFRVLRAAAEPIRMFAKQEAAENRTVHRKVVNIASVAGTGGNAGQTNYAAAKAGIVGVTRTLAKEWGRFAVNVNCVAFGWIDTRLTQPLDAGHATIDVGGRSVSVGIQASMLGALRSAVPLGRAGTPEEAAGAVYLFCTPESDYVSGQTVICGGGFGQLA